MKKRIIFPVVLVMSLLLGHQVLNLPANDLLAQSQAPNVTIATEQGQETKEVTVSELFNVTIASLNNEKYVLELPKELDWVAPEKNIAGLTYSEKTRQVTFDQAVKKEPITISLKANTVGSYPLSLVPTVEKQETVQFAVNVIETVESSIEEPAVQNSGTINFAEGPTAATLSLNRIDDLTGWTDITLKSVYTWRLSFNSEAFNSGTQTGLRLNTSFAPGGGRGQSSKIPSLEEAIQMLRVDVPSIRYDTKNLHSTIVGTTSGIVGRAPAIDANENAGATYGEADFKSLGLVVAVNNDLNTLQEISTGPKTALGYPSDESTVANVDKSTYKVYQKGSSFKFSYDVTIETYKFHVDISYMPNPATGFVSVQYTYTNIGDKTIPGLMTGFNFTPEFRTAKVTNTAGAIGQQSAGIIRYMGYNKGIYGTATAGGHRAEFYPNYRNDGPDTWAAWSEPFKGAKGNRDITKFMKGFKNPTDLYSAGDERDGIATNTQIVENAATNTNATISMKWNPQDLAVGESKTNSWAYSSEVVTSTPKLTLDEEDAYYTTSDNSAVIKGTWRNFEDGTSNNTIKYSIDGGPYQNYLVSYDKAADVGSPQDFELPISLAAPVDHTVKVHMVTPKNEKSTESSKTFKFKAPKPKFNSTISIKVDGEERTTLSPGELFTADLAMNMVTQYAQLTDTTITIPIDPAIVAADFLQELSITKQDGTAGTISYNPVPDQLEATFPTKFIAGETLTIHFAGEVHDTEDVLDQLLTLRAMVKGISGDTVKEDFDLPEAEEPVKDIEIIPATAVITVNFLDGDNLPIEGYAPYELIGKTNDPYDLSIDTNVMAIVKEIESKGYILTNSPINEKGTFNRNGTVVEYLFNGSLKLSNFATTVDFGDLAINSTTQIYMPKLIDDGKSTNNNLFFEISDTRNKADRKPWEIKASVVKELTSTKYSVPLPGNFMFKTKDNNVVTLNKSEEVIYKQSDTASKLTKISFDSNLEEGLKLKVNPGIYADSYQGEISYTLENAP